MMTGLKPHTRKPRVGITLMEVLISIGVIALGIFGVATLIPVAQFKVAEGTSRDRVASLGPSAAAKFRIQGMNDPNDWVFALQGEYLTRNSVQREQRDFLDRKAYCIDPLWLMEGGYRTVTAGQPQLQLNIFPASAASSQNPQLLGMHRVGLRSLKRPDNNRQIEAALARKVFFLADELVFDRPDDQSQAPRRQFFKDASGHPTASVTNASLSWFATVCPAGYSSDEYILSIVVVKNRLPLLSLTEDTVFAIAAGEEKVVSAKPVFAGEVLLSPLFPPTAQDELKVSDLNTGDWILLSKLAAPAGTPGRDGVKRTYRWTQIIGASDEDDGVRSFTVSNDDFLKPGEMDGTAILVRGVTAVYERTIRLEKMTSHLQN